MDRPKRTHKAPSRFCENGKETNPSSVIKVPRSDKNSGLAEIILSSKKARVQAALLQHKILLLKNLEQNNLQKHEPVMYDKMDCIENPNHNMSIELRTIVQSNAELDLQDYLFSRSLVESINSNKEVFGNKTSAKTSSAVINLNTKKPVKVRRGRPRKRSRRAKIFRKLWQQKILTKMNLEQETQIEPYVECDSTMIANEENCNTNEPSPMTNVESNIERDVQESLISHPFSETDKLNEVLIVNESTTNNKTSILSNAEQDVQGSLFSHSFSERYKLSEEIVNDNESTTSNKTSSVELNSTTTIPLRSGYRAPCTPRKSSKSARAWYEKMRQKLLEEQNNLVQENLPQFEAVFVNEMDCETHKNDSSSCLNSVKMETGDDNDQDLDQTEKLNERKPFTNNIQESQEHNVYSTVIPIIKTEAPEEDPKPVLTGNRIVDINYVLSYAIELQYEHSQICGRGKLIPINENRIGLGLVSIIFFQCNVCGAEYTYSTEDPRKDLSTSVNSGAVGGIMKIGKGYKHLQTFLQEMEVPEMTREMFSTIKGEIVEDTRMKYQSKDLGFANEM